MNIGKILGYGIGTGAALTAGTFINKINIEYSVDDVYGNNPEETGKTWKRVMCDDGSDYPHDVYVSVHKPY